MEVIDLTDEDPDCTRNDVQQNDSDELHSGYRDCSVLNSQWKKGVRAMLSLIKDVQDDATHSGPSSTLADVDRLRSCETQPTDSSQALNKGTSSGIEVEPDKCAGTHQKKTLQSQLTVPFCEERKVPGKQQPQEPNTRTEKYRDTSCIPGVSAIETVDLTEEEESGTFACSGSQSEDMNVPTSLKVDRNSSEQSSMMAASSCVIDLTDCDLAKGVGNGSEEEETYANIKSPRQVPKSKDLCAMEQTTSKDVTVCEGDSNVASHSIHDVTAWEICPGLSFRPLLATGGVSAESNLIQVVWEDAKATGPAKETNGKTGCLTGHETSCADSSTVPGMDPDGEVAAIMEQGEHIMPSTPRPGADTASVCSTVTVNSTENNQPPTTPDSAFHAITATSTLGDVEIDMFELSLKCLEPGFSSSSSSRSATPLPVLEKPAMSDRRDTVSLEITSTSTETCSDPFSEELESLSTCSSSPAPPGRIISNDTMEANSTQCEEDSQGELMNKDNVVELQETGLVDKEDIGVQGKVQNFSHALSTVEDKHSSKEQEVALVLTRFCDGMENKGTEAREQGSPVRPDEATPKQAEPLLESQEQNHKDVAVEEQDYVEARQDLLQPVHAGADEGADVDILELYEDGAAAFQAHSPVQDNTTIVNITLSPVQPKARSCSPQSMALCRKMFDMSEVESVEDSELDQQCKVSHSLECSLSDNEDMQSNKVQGDGEVSHTVECEAMDQSQGQSIEQHSQFVPTVNNTKPEKDIGVEETAKQKLPENLLQVVEENRDHRNMEEGDISSSNQTLCKELHRENQSDISKQQDRRDIQVVSGPLECTTTHKDIVQSNECGAVTSPKRREDINNKVIVHSGESGPLVSPKRLEDVNNKVIIHSEESDLLASPKKLEDINNKVTVCSEESGLLASHKKLEDVNNKVIAQSEESGPLASPKKLEDVNNKGDDRTQEGGINQSPVGEKERHQDAAPSKEDTRATDEEEKIDSSCSYTIHSPLCKDIDFSQLDISPNSSIGDAILDFVQQTQIGGQEVSEEDRKNHESDESHSKENQIFSEEVEACSDQGSSKSSGKQRRGYSMSDLMDDIGQLGEIRDGALKGNKQQDMCADLEDGPEGRQNLDPKEKQDSSGNNSRQGLVGPSNEINQDSSAGSSGEGQRSSEEKRQVSSSSRKETSTVTMATSSASTMGQVGLWDLMDHQGPFIIYPSQGRDGEGVLTAVRNYSTQSEAAAVTSSPTGTQGMAGLGNAVFSALTAVNADGSEDQPEENESTTMLDLDTHTVTTTGGMVLRSRQSTCANKCIGCTDTQGAEACTPRRDNEIHISNRLDSCKEFEGQAEEDCSLQPDSPIGMMMTRARARRLKQVLEEASSNTASSVTACNTDNHHSTSVGDMQNAQPMMLPGSMDTVAMAMMCSGLEEDAEEDGANVNDAARQGLNSNPATQGQSSPPVQLIYCIPGANVTQTISENHSDLLPTIITSMSEVAGHRVTSLTIQGQEFYFLEELAYQVYNHTVSYILSRCNHLRISRIRCRGEYLEFLRPYCHFIDRRSNHCYLIRGEDAELLYNSFQSTKKLKKMERAKERARKKESNTLAKCTHCGQGRRTEKKRGKKRPAEATVSVNPENYTSTQLQEDKAAASALQNDFAPDHPFARGDVSSGRPTPMLIGFSRDAACQTAQADRSTDREYSSPPTKRCCTGLASTACQTATESDGPLSLDQQSKGLTDSRDSFSPHGEEPSMPQRKRHESRSSLVTSTSQSVVTTWGSLSEEAATSTSTDEQGMTTFYITTKVVGAKLEKVNITVSNDRGELLSSSGMEHKDSEDQGYSETVEETPVSPVEGMGSGKELEVSNTMEEVAELEDTGISLAEDFYCDEDQVEQMEPPIADHDLGMSMREVSTSKPNSMSDYPVTCMDRCNKEAIYGTKAKCKGNVVEKHRYEVMREEEAMNEVMSIMYESGISVVPYTTNDTIQDTSMEGLGEIVNVLEDSGIPASRSPRNIPYKSGERTLQDVYKKSLMEQCTADKDTEEIRNIMKDSGISLPEDRLRNAYMDPIEVSKIETAMVEGSEGTATPDQTAMIEDIEGIATPDQTAVVGNIEGTAAPDQTAVVEDIEGTAVPDQTAVVEGSEGTATPDQTAMIEDIEGTAAPDQTAAVEDIEGIAAPDETADTEGTAAPDQTAAVGNIEGTAAPDQTAVVADIDGTAAPDQTADIEGTAAPDQTADIEGTAAPDQTAVVADIDGIAALDQNSNKIVLSEKGSTVADKASVSRPEEDNSEQGKLSMAGYIDNTCLIFVSNSCEGKAGTGGKQTIEMYANQNGPSHPESPVSEVPMDTMPPLYSIQAITEGNVPVLYSTTAATYTEPSTSKGKEMLDESVTEKNKMECRPSTLDPANKFPKPRVPADNTAFKRSKSDCVQDCTVCLWKGSALLVSHTSKGGAFTGWGYLYPHWCGSLQDPCIYCPVCNTFFSVNVYLGHFHEKQGLVVYRSSYGLQLEARQPTSEQERLWKGFIRKYPVARKGCSTPQKVQKITTRSSCRCNETVEHSGGICARFKKMKGGKWTVSTSSEGRTGKGYVRGVSDVSCSLKPLGEEQSGKMLVETACSMHQCVTEDTAAVAHQQKASCSISHSTAKNFLADAAQELMLTVSHSIEQCAAEGTAAEQQTASYNITKCAAEGRGSVVTVSKEQQTMSHSITHCTAEIIAAEEQQTAAYNTNQCDAENIAVDGTELQMSPDSSRKFAECTAGVATAANQSGIAEGTELQMLLDSSRKSAECTAGVATAANQSGIAEGTELQMLLDSSRKSAECTAGVAADASQSDIAEPSRSPQDRYPSPSNRTVSKGIKRVKTGDRPGIHCSTEMKKTNISDGRFSSELKGIPRGRRTGGRPGQHGKIKVEMTNLTKEG